MEEGSDGDSLGGNQIQILETTEVHATTPGPGFEVSPPITARVLFPRPSHQARSACDHTDDKCNLEVQLSRHEGKLV